MNYHIAILTIAIAILGFPKSVLSAVIDFHCQITRTEFNTLVAMQREELLVTTTMVGEGLIHDIKLPSGESLTEFLPGTSPPSTPGRANPDDFEPINLIDRAFFKTTNEQTAISDLSGSIDPDEPTHFPVTATGSFQTYFDPTPATDLTDAILLSEEIMTAEGISRLIDEPKSFRGTILDWQASTNVTGEVVFANTTQITHDGVTFTGEDIFGPVGTSFRTIKPLESLFSLVEPFSVIAFKTTAKTTPEPGPLLGILTISISLSVIRFYRT